MDKLEELLVGKTIQAVTVKTEFDKFPIIELLFTDGYFYSLEILSHNLIEPTLTSDVIPVGANTLGEGSV